MRLVLILTFLLSFFIKAQARPEAKLQFVDYCQYFQYPVQTHKITTEDGYILTFFRIQAKNTEIKEGLPPIYLQHGLLDCSDTFIINEEKKAPAFVLANQGYDVWLGNNRGNRHSQEHVSLKTSNKHFWRFTWSDFATYDLPAAFQYIHDHTQQQIVYIGHSQGTMQMHAHLSEFKESTVRKYMKKFIGLGPVAFIGHTQSTLTKIIMDSPVITMFESLGIHEVMNGDSFFYKEECRIICAELPSLCGDIVGAITSADWSLDDYERYDILVGHDPGGTSLRNINHFKQLMQAKNFAKFDYGKKQNREIYGQDSPPEYDLSNIDIDITYFIGYEDLLADQTDFQLLLKNLVNAKVEVNYIHAGHCSYMWGIDMSYLDSLLKVIEQ